MCGKCTRAGHSCAIRWASRCTLLCLDSAFQTRRTWCIGIWVTKGCKICRSRQGCWRSSGNSVYPTNGNTYSLIIASAKHYDVPHSVLNVGAPSSMSSGMLLAVSEESLEFHRRMWQYLSLKDNNFLWFCTSLYVSVNMSEQPTKLVPMKNCSPQPPITQQYFCCKCYCHLYSILFNHIKLKHNKLQLLQW